MSPKWLARIGRRSVRLDIIIPPPYRWVARNPWGTWIAFIRKPRLTRIYPDHRTPECWGVQRDEIEITSEALVRDCPPLHPILIDLEA